VCGSWHPDQHVPAASKIRRHSVVSHRAPAAGAPATVGLAGIFWGHIPRREMRSADCGHAFTASRAEYSDVCQPGAAFLLRQDLSLLAAGRHVHWTHVLQRSFGRSRVGRPCLFLTQHAVARITWNMLPRAA
jgi:hypothetical protein